MQYKQTAESLQPLLSSEQQTDKDTLYTVYCEHIVENIPDIVSALLPVDIVAIENVGNTKDDRERVTKLANGLSRSNVGSPEYEDVSKALESLIGNPKATFSAGLIEALGGSNKTVCFVDVSYEDPEYFAISVEDEADMAMAKALRGRNMDLIEEKFEDKLFADARANMELEKKVVDQVENLVSVNPTKIIGLVAGAVHTPISHSLSRRHHVNRVFIGLNVTNSRGFQYSIYDSLLREKTIDPDKPIDETKMKYGLLALIVAQYDPVQCDRISAQMDNDQLDISLRQAIDDLHRHRVKQRIAVCGVGRRAV